MTIDTGSRVVVRGEVATVLDVTGASAIVSFSSRGARDRGDGHVFPVADLVAVETQIFERATLFVQGEFGMAFRKVEVRTLTLERRPYAQHAHAVHVTFVPKGARSERGFVRSAGSRQFVLLAGWGHPDLGGDTMVPVSDDGHVQTLRSRFSSCDPRWTTVLAQALEGREVLVNELAI